MLEGQSHPGTPTFAVSIRDGENKRGGQQGDWRRDGAEEGRGWPPRGNAAERRDKAGAVLFLLCGLMGGGPCQRLQAQPDGWV